MSLAWALIALLVHSLGCGATGPDLEQVRALQDAGDYEAAIRDLRVILDQDPEYAEASYRLGLSMLRLGRASEAIFPLKKASQTEEYAVQAGLLLTTSLSQTGNYGKAIEAADAVLERDPNNETALIARARAALAGELGEEALESAQRLAETEADSGFATELLASAYIELDQLSDAEPLLRDLMDYAGDDPTAMERSVRACDALARAYWTASDDADGAEATMRECLERYPEASGLVTQAAQLLDDLDRRESAIELIETYLEASPDDVALREALARRLLVVNRQDEAEALMAESARTQGTVQAWAVLADVRRGRGDLDGSLEAADEAIAIGADEHFLFFRADLLLEAGRLDEAEQQLEALETLSYRQIIEGRLLQQRGDPEGALELYTSVLEDWPQNWGLRVLAARAAYDLGQDDRAISELREATRHAASQNDAAAMLAQIYLSRGEYKQARGFANRNLKERGTNIAEPQLVIAQSLVAQGAFDEARKALASLIEDSGGRFAGEALSAGALIDKRTGGSELAESNLAAGIEKYAVDPTTKAGQAAHLLLGELRLELGRNDEAVATLGVPLLEHEDSAALHALYGRLLLGAGRPDDAAQAFARALEIDPENAQAVAGQGMLAWGQGDVASALASFDRAHELEPKQGDHVYRAAGAAIASGDLEGGLKRYEEVLRISPGHAGASNDLAYYLAAEGRDLSRAAVLAERAVRFRGGPEVLDTLGYVQLKRGQLAVAREALERALGLDPGYATARFHLALVLEQQGETERARTEIERVLALEDGFTETDAARATLARLQGGAS